MCLLHSLKAKLHVTHESVSGTSYGGLHLSLYVALSTGGTCTVAALPFYRFGSSFHDV